MTPITIARPLRARVMRCLAGLAAGMNDAPGAAMRLSGAPKGNHLRRDIGLAERSVAPVKPRQHPLF